MRKIGFNHAYQDIISMENLLEAWKEFIRGKRNRKDVQEFQAGLFDHLLELHNELEKSLYIHGPYKAFRLNDPKPRDIHKATVRDRLLHHALYRRLYLFFDRRFTYDSYSCRNGKGSHKALERFGSFASRASWSHTKTLWVLKCDIRKFFASVDHDVLLAILKHHVNEERINLLVERIVSSFHSHTNATGLPLGNLTSQLFVNIYMNEFDQFIKHKLKVKYYIRYADDFVILDQDRHLLLSILADIRIFLQEKLHLTLHQNKVFIKSFASGVDFLGWVHFPGHSILRTSTKKRMFKKISENVTEKTIVSYHGLLKHGNAHKLRERLPTPQSSNANF